jgi:hypothetical protein
MLRQIIMVMSDAMKHNSLYVYDQKKSLLDVLVFDAKGKLLNLIEIKLVKSI